MTGEFHRRVPDLGRTSVYGAPVPEPDRALAQAASAAATEQRVGLLTMAYGTASTPAEIFDYYTHIRHGRPPAQDLIDDLTQRYRSLPGGRSPLIEISHAQTSTLVAQVAAVGVDLAVAQFGCKHAAPFIEDAVELLAAEGAERIVGLVFAPHWSTMSVAEYLGRVRRTAARVCPDALLNLVSDWYLAPGYIDWLARAVTAALDRIPAAARPQTEVVFTAHSLPTAIVADGDPYPQQLQMTASAVAERLGLNNWSIGWQSAGQTAAPWLGPDILEILPQLKRDGRHGAVVCACGFVSDHLEVIYDLDIETAAAARKLGLEFERTAMPNDDPAFVAVLRDVVLAALAGPVGKTAAEQAAVDRHATATGQPDAPKRSPATATGQPDAQKRSPAAGGQRL